MNPKSMKKSRIEYIDINITTNTKYIMLNELIEALGLIIIVDDWESAGEEMKNMIRYSIDFIVFLLYTCSFCKRICTNKLGNSSFLEW